MKQCSNCGRALAPEARFCPACGAQQEVRSPQETPVQEGPRQQNARQPSYDAQQASYTQQQSYSQQAYSQQAYEQPYAEQPYAGQEGPSCYMITLQTNGKATASLVLGILSMIPAMPFSFFLLPLLAVIFGAIGRKECPEGHPKRSSATAGLILGVVKLSLVILLAVLLLLCFQTIISLLGDYPFVQEILEEIREVFEELF